MSDSLSDPASNVPQVPSDVPHPSWCDPRRCHVDTARCADGLEPLLVHEGDHWRGLNRAVVLMQCEVLDPTLTRVVETCQPMAKIEGDFIEDPFTVDGSDFFSRALETVRGVRCLPVMPDRSPGWVA